MHATSLAVLLLLSHSCAVLAAPAASEDTGVGPPPALAPGQAPPLPVAGPLAEPRSLNQVGLPAVLTKWVISPPNSRMPARAALGQKLFFDARLSANGTRRLRHLPQSGPCFHRWQAYVHRHPR